MIIDCDRCVVRGDACADCVITVLLGPPSAGLELDGADRKALDALAAAGMVPRLQLVELDPAESEADHFSGMREACWRETGTDVGCKPAKRSADGAERSERYAG